MNIDWRRWTTRFLASVFIVSVVNIAANSLSLFGFHDATAAFSRDLTARFMAPLYPAPAHPASAVVLVDDRSDILDDTYPLKLGTHAQILEVLLEYKPKAVYVDFAFFDARADATIDRFKLAVRRFRERGVPLYVAAYTPTNRPERGPIRPELRELVASGDIRLVSFALGPTVWGIPTYQFFDREQRRPTAVARLVSDLYPERRAVFDGDNSMEIAWALPPSAFNCRRAGGCGKREYTWWARLLGGIKLTGVIQWAAPVRDPAIIQYIPNLAAQEILDGDAAESIAPVLADKVIFYGPNFDVARDAIPNPVFTYADERGTLPGRQVPGAFVHAMAFENVIDLGASIKRPRPDDQIQWEIEGLLIVAFSAVFLAAAGLSQFAVAKAEGLPQITDFALGRIVRAAGIAAGRSLSLLIPAVVALATAWIQYRLFNRAPSNWCGIFMLLTLSSVLRWDQWASARTEKAAAWLSKHRQTRTEHSDALA